MFNKSVISSKFNDQNNTLANFTFKESNLNVCKYNNQETQLTKILKAKGDATYNRFNVENIRIKYNYMNYYNYGKLFKNMDFGNSSMLIHDMKKIYNYNYNISTEKYYVNEILFNKNNCDLLSSIGYINKDLIAYNLLYSECLVLYDLNKYHNFGIFNKKDEISLTISSDNNKIFEGTANGLLNIYDIRVNYVINKNNILQSKFNPITEIVSKDNCDSYNLIVNCLEGIYNYDVRNNNLTPIKKNKTHNIVKIITLNKDNNILYTSKVGSTKINIYDLNYNTMRSTRFNNKIVDIKYNNKTKELFIKFGYSDSYINIYKTDNFNIANDIIKANNDIENINFSLNYENLITIKPREIGIYNLFNNHLK